MVWVGLKRKNKKSLNVKAKWENKDLTLTLYQFPLRVNNKSAVLRNIPELRNDL